MDVEVESFRKPEVLYHSFVRLTRSRLGGENPRHALMPEKRAIGIVRILSKEDFGNPLLDEEGRWRHQAHPGTADEKGR